MMKYGFGVDIGGTTVKIAFFDQDGNMLCKWEIPTCKANGGNQILEDVAASIDQFMREKKTITRDRIIGIGIGVPGPVLNGGIVNRCVNLGWGVKKLQAELSELTGFPVVVGNDANVAALGECWKGGGQGCSSMAMVTLGTGIGGGIIVDGKIVSGAHGAGGEIGHLVLESAETEVCGCGKCGCAEQYCSATGVVRVAKRLLAVSPLDSRLRKLNTLTCKDIFDAGNAGDELALAILEQIYENLGRFLANVCCVTDPEVIVLGGGVSKAGAPLIQGAARYYQKYAFHACRGTKIVLAELGNDAGAYGAFKLALDSFGA